MRPTLCPLMMGLGQRGHQPERRALRYMATRAMVTARVASASQTASHAAGLGWRAARMAAAIAVQPMNTCPQPEVAVKVEDRSMVSRM
jgi:hypothetical protein